MLLGCLQCSLLRRSTLRKASEALVSFGTSPRQLAHSVYVQTWHNADKQKSWEMHKIREIAELSQVK